MTGAEFVVPCPELDRTLAFFTERLGFRVDAIIPADDPVVVVVSGHGVRLRLDRGARGSAGALRLRVRDRGAIAGGATELVAPNGTRIELVPEESPIVLPPVRQSLVVTRLGDDAHWSTGRAGMRYRDLIPDRQGGRFIASHIQIPDGGLVPDYVHYHRIRFQMIYCHRGWVRVVYEDQGPPFVLEAGDCVLQPPQIRHRVLECSPGLEVIEIGSPSDHETHADHVLELPTEELHPGRDFGGQTFVRHRASSAVWEPWWADGFEARDIGIAGATDGLAGVRVARPTTSPSSPATAHDAELVFMFVLDGRVTLRCDGHDSTSLGAGDSFAVPAGLAHALADCSGDLQLLEVSLPARPARRSA